MDIFDAQFHMTAGSIESTLAAMDAIGIASVLIDEFWFDPVEFAEGRLNPGYPLANGAWRSMWPTAELASILHPDRFSSFVRVERRDPDLDAVMRLLGTSPFTRAFRVLATRTPEESEAFAGGGYDELFAIASGVGMPVCLYIPGAVHHLPRYLERYPDLTFVVDHCGMGPPERQGRDDGPVPHEQYFDVVLELAQHPNVALKWSHAQRLFDAPDRPYEPVRPFLRRAIDAFGADRLLWASDVSMMPGHTWSDLAHYIRDDPTVTEDEKAWILGRTARRIFDWPAADPAA